MIRGSVRSTLAERAVLTASSSATRIGEGTFGVGGVQGVVDAAPSTIEEVTLAVLAQDRSPLAVISERDGWSIGRPLGDAVQFIVPRWDLALNRPGTLPLSILAESAPGW